ncbi:MAG TPA: hypothetical protein VHS28_00445 [Chloroflexota bacterium]|nr:hypothetical protein [Chloroflexota bacterium]
MLGRLAVLLRFWRLGGLAWRLLRDRRVPLRLKLIPLVALLYFVSPVNLRLLFIPVVGVLDGVTVLVLALGLFVWLCPRELVREQLDSMAGKPPPDDNGKRPSGPVIEGEYEILE